LIDITLREKPETIKHNKNETVETETERLLL